MKYANGTDFGEAVSKGHEFAFFLEEKSTFEYFMYYALLVATMAGLIWMIVREVIQFYSEPCQYWKSTENLIEVFFLLCSWTYIIWVQFSMEYEQIFGAISIFLALIDLNIMLGTLPQVGTYSYIAICQLKLFIKFFAIFTFTLFSIAITLHLFLIRDYKENGVFDNPWTSFLKVFI